MAGTAACASTPAPLPTPATGDDAEVTVDGLVRMDNTVMELGWAKPDLDLTSYAGFMLDPVTVAYQREPGQRTRGSVGSNFALTDRQMETLRTVFQEQVIEALTEGDGYRLVREPAPNVLRMTAELVDLVVRVPTERTGGRGRVVASSYGAVTLIVEVRDSQSGEILARVADRQDPTESARDFAEVNRTFVRSDVTRMFRHWADLLRGRLDQLRAAAM